MSVSTFTVLHTGISLVGIFAGLVVLFGMFKSKRLEAWTAVFLFATVLTSVTGFFFPVDKILPSHIVGVLSLLVLAVTLTALYVYRLAGKWRWLYVASAVLALYLNVFVGVVQAFGKVPFLTALAPTQKDPPFIIAQAVVLLLFIYLGIKALRSFHPIADVVTSRTAPA
ncbi:MAG: hypothetical protein ABI580_00310 [Burkholderiaceae bacterium]